MEEFAAKVRSGEITGSTGRPFTAVAVNGIGGSALGPQLLQFAINGPYWNELSAEKRQNGLKIYFLDNTDSAEFADLCQVMDPETTLPGSSNFTNFIFDRTPTDCDIQW